jgi:hypothetical protein
VDFLHDGKYAGHGLVERRDGRFWYARFMPGWAAEQPGETGASRAAASQPTTMAAVVPNSNAETQSAVPAESPLRVGDDVLIRTQEDIGQQRFVARVFNVTPEGALASAGEADEWAAGQVVAVTRDGRPVGTAAVQRVQRSYAVVQPARTAEGEPLQLRVGDELSAGAQPPAPVIVGTIQSVADETLIRVRLTGAAPRLAAPLAVRAGRQTIGVAVLVTSADGASAGFVLPGSLTRAVSVGMELLQEGHPAEPAGE